MESAAASIRPLPLYLGDAQTFARLRTALADLHFDEASICALVGIRNIFEFSTRWEGREPIELSSALAALIHVFLDGEKLGEDQLHTVLPTEAITVFKELGLLVSHAHESGMVYSPVALYPVASLYIASDRNAPVDDSVPFSVEDAVYAAITLSGKRFLASLPSSPCEELLDLCAGTGVAAFHAAARYARHAWSCDLSERCTHFAEFNRRLNGIENATVAEGDLYDAVKGRTFDRIVAHPPYVPTAEQKILYRDGGQDGEQILSRIVVGLPLHLRPGGRFYSFTLATDRENAEYEQRVRQWLGEHSHEFDVYVIAVEVPDEPDYILRNALKTALKSTRRSKNTPNFDLLRDLRVTSMYYAITVIERLATDRPAITARTRKAARANDHAVEWFIRWSRAGAAAEFDNDLLEARPRMTDFFRLQVSHSVRNAVLIPSRFDLHSDYPFAVSLSCPAWVAAVVSSCNGARRCMDIFESLQQQNVIDPAVTKEQFAGSVRTLIAHGFVEVEQFRLPHPENPDKS